MTAVHFRPPTMPWPEGPDKLGDVLLVIFTLPSALPKTLRSSNNLYEGTKGFCPVAGARLLGLILAGVFPCIADPLLPLAGKEL